MRASIFSQFGIAAGELALDRSRRDDIRQIARRTVADHKRIHDRLEAAIARSEVDASLADNLIDAIHTDVIAHMNNTLGTRFDQVYVDRMVEAQAAAIDMYQRYALYGDEPELREYAVETLPVLKEHQVITANLQYSY